MASTLTMNPLSGGGGGNNCNTDPYYKPLLKPMAPRRQLGKMAFREQDVMHMRKQLSGEAEGGVLGYIADHYRPDYGKHTHVVEQLRFTNLDLSALLSDKKSFGALQKSLRKQGAITNQLLEQGLSFFIMNNRAFLMQRLEQQRREEERNQRLLEEQALLAMLEEENRKYEQEMQRMQSKDYNPEDDEMTEESESIRQEEEKGEESNLYTVPPTTTSEGTTTTVTKVPHTTTQLTSITSKRASRVLLAEGVGFIAKQQQVDDNLDTKPFPSGRNYLMFAQTLGGGLGQIELDSDDDEDKENAEEQKRHEEWNQKQKEREAEIKRLRKKVEASKKMREKLAAAKKMRLNADRKKRESKVMSSANQEKLDKIAKPSRSSSREAALEALKGSDSQAAMKQMREKMASYKKKRPINASISAEKLPSLKESNSLKVSSESGDSEEKMRSVGPEKSDSHGVKSLSESSDSEEEITSDRRQKSRPAGSTSSASASSRRRNSDEKSEKPLSGRTNSLSCKSNRAALVADAVERATEAKEAANSNCGTTTNRSQRKTKYDRLSVNVQVMKDSSMRDDSSMSASKQDTSRRKEEDNTDA